MSDKYTRAARRLRAGGVGGPSIRANWPGRGVGSPNIRANWPGRRGVGAPARRVPTGTGSNEVLYSEPDYVAGEVTWLPFRGDTAIGIAGSATAIQTVPVATDRPFEPQDLRFPSTLEDIVLLEAKIQGTNLIANSVGVPLELLSEVTTLGAIDWFTIDTASGAQLTFENIGAVADQIMRGAFWGTALRR